MLKQIAFAYPSSTYAVRFGRAASGCFLVATTERLGCLESVVSVHDELADAIAAAEAVDCPWSPLYRDRPLPGHDIN